jgi:hypothetical protein
VTEKSGPIWPDGTRALLLRPEPDDAYGLNGIRAKKLKQHELAGKLFDALYRAAENRSRTGGQE